MAKVKNCPFCGKEIKLGFLGIFGGDAKKLELGGIASIHVCEDCEKKHHKFVENDNGRFGVKFENFIEANDKNFDDKVIANMFLEYCEQAQSYKANCNGEKPITPIGNFYDYSENGFFWTIEELIDDDNPEDYFEENLLKFAEGTSLKSPCGFTKNDISCIEYCVLCDSNDLEEDENLNCKRYSLVGIKLNDYTQMTYKPCFTKAVVITLYKGLVAKEKNIERDILTQLEEFRNAIGANDIPIVKVKKF